MGSSLPKMNVCTFWLMTVRMLVSNNFDEKPNMRRMGLKSKESMGLQPENSHLTMQLRLMNNSCCQTRLQ